VGPLQARSAEPVLSVGGQQERALAQGYCRRGDNPCGVRKAGAAGGTADPAPPRPGSIKPAAPPGVPDSD